MGSDGGQTEGCSGLASLWHLFEVQMIGLKRNVEFITFKNGCQGTVLIFAANGRFHNKGSISQLRNEGGLRNGTRVPNSGFVAAKPAAKWGYGCENWIFLGFRDFVEHFTATK